MADKKDQNDIPDLGELRESIDELDQLIVDLLNKRAEVSLSVGRYKAAKGEAIYKPFREQEVMDKIANSSPGPLPDKHLRTIYREIMSSSRHLQRPERVVYLGPEGTFSYFAAIEHMGSSASLTPKGNFEEIFRAVAEEGAELGVIPLENSIEGTVGQVVDLFMKYKVYIQAEVFSRISHCLISHADKVDDVEVIYSHPQPLGQCRDWLHANLRDVPTIPMESTAEAAETVATKKAAAVIGHRKLADMHGMNVLAESIEDLPDNWTRFVIIGACPVPGGPPRQDLDPVHHAQPPGGAGPGADHPGPPGHQRDQARIPSLPGRESGNTSFSPTWPATWAAAGTRTCWKISANNA